MVDCDLIDMAFVDSNARRKIIQYMLDKGIDPQDLGFSREYIESVLRGNAEVNNMLLCAALRFMDLDELNRVIGYVPRMATEDDLIMVISRAKRDEAYRRLLLEAVNRAFREEQAKGSEVTVSGLGYVKYKLPDLALTIAKLERKLPERTIGAILWSIKTILMLFAELVFALAIAFFIIHAVPGAGHLVDPVNSFLRFLLMVLHGNLGWSRTYGAPVAEIIALAAPWTITIATISLTLAFITGYTLGLVSASRTGIIDSFINGLAAFAQSVPSYVIALTLIVVFGVVLKILPIAGINSMGIKPGVSIFYFIDVAKHLILPIFSYYIILFPNWVFITRSLATMTLTEDYVLTAKARGLRERRILNSYIGKNSILPQLTLLAYSYGLLFGNSVFIETMFAIPGLGYLISVTAGTSDYMTTVGAFMVIIISVIIGNFIADLTYGLVDPRIRGVV
ncbi:ABC transporter permease [Caldivirga maquilingensis]|uniref:Binding-protein-dependent transport systems inner membrane component n=1 Tax=Caldivirga maquilingensis (strain ATCC 700844 / DSM 13496 / JCM 10307 / IC-167) TaxID=397948 RepID=A8MA63_CALMQ|nr:ABC transporter permease [Caldivirga maquilingensis]ABW00995.1 binding-protein-dependent transport systems inner membrane component [Caldivirga maquilingensis IC-167]